MLGYNIINEFFHNEPPPVLYIHGDRSDFHELLISLLPLIKEQNYKVSSKDLKYLNILEYTVIFSNEGRNGIDISNDILLIDLEIKDWIDIIIILVNIAFIPSTNFLELDCFGNRINSVIFESQ